VTTLDFSLAETHFRVIGSSTLPPLRPPDNYSLFLNANKAGQPAATYTARPGNLLPEDGRILWDNGIWRTRESGDFIDIEVNDIHASRWLRAAHIASDYSHGDLFVPQPAPDAPFIRPLYHPQDRAIILGRFCHLESIMVHSSAVLVDGKVILFSGMSGAGKTTIARLWQAHGGTLLNDERNLLRPDE
jgi:hypothetical protein